MQSLVFLLTYFKHGDWSKLSCLLHLHALNAPYFSGICSGNWYCVLHKQEMISKHAEGMALRNIKMASILLHNASNPRYDGYNSTDWCFTLLLIFHWIREIRQISSRNTGATEAGIFIVMYNGSSILVYGPSLERFVQPWSLWPGWFS